MPTIPIHTLPCTCNSTVGGSTTQCPRCSAASFFSLQSAKPTPLCNCYSPWMSVTPPPPCPVHGRAEMSGVRVEWAR